MRKSLWMGCCFALSWSIACGAPPGRVPTPVAMPITVTGTVVDDLGKPDPNALLVLVGSGRPPQRVDGTGHFTLPEVTPPYDLAIVADPLHPSVPVFVYQGLTREDPSLTVYLPLAPGDVVFGSVQRAQLAGTVSGGETPSSTKPLSVMIGSGDSLSSPPAITSAAYSGTVFWSTPGPSTTSVSILQSVLPTPDSTIPTRYVGFGRREHIPVNDGDSLTDQDISLAAVTNSTLQGSVLLSKDTLFSGVDAQLRLHPPPSVGGIPLFFDPAPTPAFSYAVPVIDQGLLSMSFSARSNIPGDLSFTINSLDSVPPGVPLVVALPGPPRLLAPAEDATLVGPGTDFSWSAFPGVFSMGISSPDLDAYFSLVFITQATHVTLPDLSALGVSLPASRSLSWSVWADGNMATVDAVTDPARQRARGLKTGLTGISMRRSFTSSGAP